MTSKIPSPYLLHGDMRGFHILEEIKWEQYRGIGSLAVLSDWYCQLGLCLSEDNKKLRIFIYLIGKSSSLPIAPSDLLSILISKQRKPEQRKEGGKPGYVISDCRLIGVWQIASEQTVLCFIFSLNHFSLKFRIICCVKSQIFEATPLGGGKEVEK